MRAIAIWLALCLALAVPLGLAAGSPLLEWRQPVYIAAGFAGILALGLMLVQPLLAAGWLPGLRLSASRRAHRWTGAALLALIVLHVAALWVTSPPDVVDALLLVSPTPFSHWAVLSMWAVFGAAAWAFLRGRVAIRPGVWRFGHTILVVIAVVGAVLHAMLVDGTMEPLSKAALCLCLLLVTGAAVRRLRAWSGLRRRRA